MSLYYDKATGVTALLAEIRASAVGDDDQAKALGAHGVPFKYKNWTMVAQKSHITPLQALDSLGSSIGMTPPEMVFGKNQLLLLHEPSGMCLSFMAVEALSCCHFKPGDDTQQLKVSVARDQSASDEVKELAITYDWTYTSDYKGTLGRVDGNGLSARMDDGAVRVQETTERIDFEKLKLREDILWMEDINLYEDELHDHGVSVYSIRMRVMPSGFYVLARYWMRLDNVLVRLNETRIHHIFGSDHMLREYTAKEVKFDALFAQGHPTHMSNYTNIDTFQRLVPTVESKFEKIFLE
ncbi:Aste57867_21790 [Aphanomyces stellatus]|uniref:Aste57867_21790 protein n=1 Tax=Aphanomyces stellatus TaxID=120398 RepID=A0A485LJ42_9STRA|nr:hypothetical protein As57867_021721 [Aphanomyces stellatus]VFT98459.1 Aste57867_21790 [Aphanomyces stellatus]